METNEVRELSPNALMYTFLMIIKEEKNGTQKDCAEELGRELQTFKQYDINYNNPRGWPRKFSRGDFEATFIQWKKKYYDNDSNRMVRRIAFNLSSIGIDISHIVQHYETRAAENADEAFPFFVEELLDETDRACTRRKNHSSDLGMQFEELPKSNEQSVNLPDCLKYLLAPIRSSFWIDNYRQENFVGRTALFQSFDAWRDKSVGMGSRILLLKGNLGTGKTQLMVKLEQAGKLKVFYCRRSSSVAANPRMLVYFIADHLYQSVQEYASYWKNNSFPDDLQTQPTDYLISALLSIPLSSFEPKQDIIFGIDALDEAVINDGNEIAKTLAQLFEWTPNWIRFVITGRDTADLQTLVGQNQIWNLSDFGKDEDMREYLNTRLAPLHPTQTQIDTLAAKADGVFLYAKTICIELLNGVRSLNNVSTFPVGMAGVYAECINRAIKKSGFDYVAALKPALEILAASYDPVSTELLGAMENRGTSYLSAMAAVVELFPQRDGMIAPAHSSVFEWLTSSSAGIYCINVIQGHQKLAHYFDGKSTPYALRYLTAHALKSGDISLAKRLLKNADFQDNRFQKLGTEAIRTYLLELKQLCSENSSAATEVMESSCFRELILGKYRKACFDSGYFFILDELKFDKILESRTEFWGYPVEAGIALYKYSTKTFHDAMPILEQLLLSDCEMDVNEKAELRNMYALCLLKNSDYAAANENYQNVLNSNPNRMHQAEAYMNLGKLACYQLVSNWKKISKQSFNASISCLEEERQINPSQDLSLKAADYYRISALYAGIWGCDLEHAETALARAKTIYDDVPVRARYHARYVYTNAALKIFRDRLDEAFQDLNDLQNSKTEITKDYETAQIAFFIALIHIMKNDIGNARAQLEKVLNVAGSINSWIEYEEARTLLSEITGKESGTEDTSKLPGITYIRAWGQHVADVTDSLRGAADT